MAEKRFQKKDEELFAEVEKLKNGNYESYEKVYELSKKYIYKIINDVVKNHYTTEDLMQETYLQVYRKIDTLMEPKAFYVWAGRIASNLSYRHIEKNKNEISYEQVLDSDEETDTIFDRASNDTEAFIPETVLENAEQQRIIAGILEGLSAEQKLCVQYYYFEELSVNDIAQIMECSTGTVKSRLNYARKALKEAINTFEVKNDVKLYSMASLPVFFIVFKKMADALVFSAAAVGAGAMVAGGVVVEEAMVGSGAASGGSAAAGVAGGSSAAGVAGGSVAAGTAAGGSVAVGVAGKVAVVVTAVCVSTGSAAISTEIATNNMIDTKGYVITKEEALEDVYSQFGVLSPTAQVEYSQNIEELMGDTNLTDLEMTFMDKEYLKAVDNLAAAMVEYENAMQYAMTPEQYAYIDEIMSAYYAEMETYINNGVQYGMIEASDFVGTFENQYMPELINLINEETELVLEIANIYSREEVKNALYTHTADELEYMSAGDLIKNEISEVTAQRLEEVSRENFALIDKMIAWSEKVMSDPNYKDYFVAY